MARYSFVLLQHLHHCQYNVEFKYGSNKLSFFQTSWTSLIGPSISQQWWCHKSSAHVGMIANQKLLFTDSIQKLTQCYNRYLQSHRAYIKKQYTL